MNTTPSTTTSTFSSFSPFPPTISSFLSPRSTEIIFPMTVASSAVVHSTHKTPSTGTIRVTVSLSSCTFYNISSRTTFSSSCKASRVIQTSFATLFASGHVAVYAICTTMALESSVSSVCSVACCASPPCNYCSPIRADVYRTRWTVTPADRILLPASQC